MTDKAKKMLKRIGDTDESSMRLPNSMHKTAQELIDSGHAIFIPYSQGGGEVALTRKGIDEYENLCSKEVS